MENRQHIEKQGKITCAFIKSKHYCSVLVFNPKTMDHQNATYDQNQNDLRKALALGHGFELFAQYNEKQSAEFLQIHAVTLKKKRLKNQIGFLRKGQRTIAYLGFQLADYLITNIQPCQNNQPDFNLETTGSQGDPTVQFGYAHGSIHKPDRRAVSQLALKTLKSPKNC